MTDVLDAPLMIDGAARRASSAGSVDHIDPASGKPQAEVVMAGPQEVDDAVQAAARAFVEWRRWRPEERRRVLTRLTDLMRADVERLTMIQVKESGIPAQLAPMIVTLGADWGEVAASWADKLNGEVVPVDPTTTFDYTVVEPVGVVAVILTWNGPVGSLGMCVMPALAAGCTVVVKPSELAPFSSIRFSQLALEAGLPPGVLNVVPGGPEAGAALVTHPGVAKVSFTGGTATARRISAACAESLKPLVLELGGKSANIVFADANLAKAVPSALSILGLSGQGCTLPSRLLVEDSVYDTFVPMVAEAMKQVPVGDPLDPQVMMGPVINAAACERILGMIERGKSSAELLAGGERLGGSLADGYFIAPTVFGQVDPADELAVHEVFGPVLAVTRFSDEDEAVDMANASEYGLAAYLHTSDIGRAVRVAGRLEAGSIGVNGGQAPAHASAPFGGVKQSGYGREGGKLGLLEFVHVKNVMVDIT